MEIRRARPEDASALAAFDALRLSRDVVELEPLITKALTRGRDKAWLAEIDGHLVGYAKAFWVGPDHRALRGLSDGVRIGFYLMGLEVAPDARRQGVGTALTHARLDWLVEQGANEVFYLTNVANDASLALHAHLGFERVGSVPGDGHVRSLSRLALQPEVPLRFGVDVPRDALVALYDSVGWSAYTGDVDKLVRAVAGSTWVATRWHGDRLVALCRVISDDASLAYLQDVLVEPAWQRRGLGRALVRLALDRFDHVRQFVLLTDDRPEQHAFYRAMGLVDIDGAPLHCFARISGLS